MIKRLTKEQLEIEVRLAWRLDDSGRVDHPGVDRGVPLGDLLRGKLDYDGDPFMKEGCWTVSRGREEDLVIAKLDDAWYALDDLDEAKRMGFSEIVDGVPPPPRHSVGDAVWIAETVRGQEPFPCPDCLDTGKWTAESPAGSRIQFACPRCDGRGKLTQSKYVPAPRLFVIGSVETRTNVSYGSRVEYHDGANGCGRVIREWAAFGTREEAENFASLLADQANERLDEGHEKRSREEFRLTRGLRLEDAELKKAREGRAEAEWLLQNTRRRIGELTDDVHFVDGERQVGDHLERFEGSTDRLTMKQAKAVQNELMWLEDENTEWLNAWRAEREA